MRLTWWKFAGFTALFAALCLPVTAWGVSCTTESQMTAVQRNVYEQAARALGSAIQAGNVAAVRAKTIASVAAHFDSLTASIEQVSPEIQKAGLTVDALYGLEATDIKPD